MLAVWLWDDKILQLPRSVLRYDRLQHVNCLITWPRRSRLGFGLALRYFLLGPKYLATHLIDITDNRSGV
jgi:hypothetical protein